VHVPYKGGAHALQDVLGSQIPAMISVFASTYPLVQSSKLRALVVTAPQRSPLLPDVPTAREAGCPEMEAVEWFGLFMPAKTPAAIVEAFHSSVQQALQTAAIKEAFAKQSFDVSTVARGDFAALIKADTERWGGIVKASGFNPID
jgi:tripartite-type tricarboxylate transporter receptor subunit TctC